ncbi:hypothetical protein V8C35DRAFT_314468 [Trichoderma chlorosporum]
MPPPKPATSTSTENLLLKCQKETRKKCLPPEWSIRPPNQEFHPPKDTIALAVQIDASSPSAVSFYESATDRLVGSIGHEFRGSMVIVPWRPGLKFVCQSNYRRRAGCRIGIVREAKGRMGVRMKSIDVSKTTVISSKKSGIAKESRKSAVGAENVLPAASPKTPSPTGKSGHISRIPRPISRDKSHSSRKHVSIDDRGISGKSSIETDGSGSPKLTINIDVKPGQRC